MTKDHNRFRKAKKGFSIRDRLQIKAFHLIYRILGDREEYVDATERFCRAIVATSDIVFDKVKPSPEMKLWLRNYGN